MTRSSGVDNETEVGPGLATPTAAPSHGATARPVRLPETPAVLALRHAVRAWLARFRPTQPGVAVALSGGADSLALTAAAVAEAATVDALIVDHRLQAGSDEVAATAAAVARALGCRSVRVLPVDVDGPGGMEAAARAARYGVLDRARGELPVLLGHTLDDQAETVLLGLGRGSGARSIQGMAQFDNPWGRPLLNVRRATTRQFCADLGLSPYEDPHNLSPEFTRVRLRTEVLPLLEDVLGGGAAVALARTADLLREDNTALDGFAAELLVRAEFGGPGLSCAVLADAAAAVRRRTVRAWLLAGGVRVVTGAHLRAVDDLVVAWHGQGGVAVSGKERGIRLVVAREHGRLTLARATG
ncbi:tRNA lysidine(34) synthetase TilS [Nocardia flavorosea]|uniref:tRNA lysidine(34) synthetase TilS n=1 Tax=Nocardia flavorosea TaxID=53429 RepID=UPI00189540F6|nr:tRNA lysidine(34) synthetase TilS [Nocardia flavorosea]MBF6349821.1 tRNA lysidine(34) synthetase TilS [Nocardia flavorosea]